MKVTINGQSQDLPDEAISLSRLVEYLGFGAIPVLIEHNGEAILRREFDAQNVSEGDVIEVIRMVAGG
ncbi:MAG: sulfur carrier protein ThiS [Verrucomicrobiales bacterium]|jgi:sulfur carrier protein|nr:sulfur carrier protein ThiS [Verrucomicrobiales bacterium]